MLKCRLVHAIDVTMSCKANFNNFNEKNDICRNINWIINELKLVSESVVYIESQHQVDALQVIFSSKNI